MQQVKFIPLLCYNRCETKGIEKVVEICYNKVITPQITERNSTTIEYYNTKKRYCPHLLKIKIMAVKMFRETKDIDYVVRRYKVGGSGIPSTMLKRRFLKNEHEKSTP